MTNSRSSASRNSVLAALVVCCAMLAAGGVASAERKRVVVLEFEGPKAQKFHDDLVKLIKKTHTVVPIDKWNGTAEELDVSAVSENSLKKVARKLKIDAIVEGKIEKRRNAFIIHLKLREGRSGALIGSVIDTKAAGPRIDSRAQRDLKGELVDAISKVEANRPISSDDEDDDDARPAKKAERKTDEEDDKPAVKKAGKQADDDDTLPPKKAAKKADDDAAPARKAVARKTDDDDALPAKQQNTDDDKRAKARKKVAARDDDAEVDAGAVEPVNAAAARSPGERALDVVVGGSVTSRQLAFQTRPGLMATPPAYKGAPVGGVMFDATLYPFAVGHKRGEMLNNIGLDVMYDRVISVKTKDPNDNVHGSKETRFGIGGVFRYPFSRSATSPVVMATFGYASQLFSIDSGAQIGMPSVKYSIFEPGAGLRFPATSQIILGVDARLMLISDTGQIQDATQYGAANVLGFEGAAGVDVMITRNLFARAAFRYETIGYTFTGTGMLSTGRDGTQMGIDVPGARDSYIGGMATLGYAY
jgi:opacity protein-like surface antigen